METDKQLKNILIELGHWIKSFRIQAFDDGFAFTPKCEIIILGQMGLLVDNKIAAILNPVATADLDAWIKADNQITTKLKALLKEKGYVLDPDSDKVWLPDEYETDLFYKDDHITCLKIKPIYLLVSKAVKAKEKNRDLIADALLYYKQDLEQLILKYGGDIKYFIGEK